MSKKLFLTAVIVLVAVIFGLASYRYIYMPWREVKQKKISLGLARANFPYRDYSEEDLGKMYPQVQNADVKTRVTPEETYAIFRQGLKDNDLAMVLGQLYKDSSRYEGNVTSISQAYEDGRFSEIYEKYPEVIENVWLDDALCSIYVCLY